MDSSAATPTVTLQLSSADARSLSALLIQYEAVQRELRHARETHYRRGDDASEERVLDLECERMCQAERLAQLVARTMAEKLVQAGAPS